MRVNEMVKAYYAEMLEFIEQIEAETGIRQIGERRNLNGRFRHDIKRILEEYGKEEADMFVAMWKGGIDFKIEDYKYLDKED